MREWWHWSQSNQAEPSSFGIVGLGRFGSAVCKELMQNGAEVLAVDRSSKAIEELRQLEPSIEARIVDCTDEEALREAGILDMETVVSPSANPSKPASRPHLLPKTVQGARFVV